MGFLEVLKEALKRIFGKRGAPKSAKEVDFAEIERIINYDGKPTDTLTPSQYVDWVNEEIDKLGKRLGINLIDNILISEADGRVIFLIMNLYFLVNSEAIISFEPKFYTSYEFGYNTFLCKKKSKSSITFQSLGLGIINIRKNKFENIELFFNNLGDNELSKKYVEIINNEIFAIIVRKDNKVFFKQGNEIGNLNITEDETTEGDDCGVMWSPYEKVNLEAVTCIYTRESFLILKEGSIKNGDKSQEALFNRELLKCDRVLFYSKDGGASIQDRLIMWFGEAVSDHGVSLLRPLFWLLVMNAIFTFLIFLIDWYEGCMMDFWEWANIWAKMLNPLNNLSEATGIDNFLVSLISAMQKTVFALLVYELIRVGRRFTPK